MIDNNIYSISQWDSGETTETVRWGVGGVFDVVHVAVDPSGRVTAK